MLHIITGKINCGKTTRLLTIYNTIRQGDGFAIRKIYIGNDYAGQEILRLSTKESRPFSFRDGFIPQSWDEKCRYFNYSFSESGFNFAEGIIEDLLKNNIEPVFIDEIGPLELQGKGFCDIFNLVLQNCSDIYAVVRESCVEDVVKKFCIKEYIDCSV